MEEKGKLRGVLLPTSSRLPRCAHGEEASALSFGLCRSSGSFLASLPPCKQARDLPRAIQAKVSKQASSKASTRPWDRGASARWMSIVPPSRLPPKGGRCVTRLARSRPFPFPLSLSLHLHPSVSPQQQQASKQASMVFFHRLSLLPRAHNARQEQEEQDDEDEDEDDRLLLAAELDKVENRLVRWDRLRTRQAWLRWKLVRAFDPFFLPFFLSLSLLHILLAFLPPRTSGRTNGRKDARAGESRGRGGERAGRQLAGRQAGRQTGKLSSQPA